MADFYQGGVITTLHKLTERPLAELEAELARFGRRHPMTLILPSLYSELAGPALARIVAELSEARYIDEIVVGLDRADADEFAHARRFFERLPQRLRILWQDGPRLRALDEALRAEGLAPRQEGKGRNVWYCLGYVASVGRARAIALHDCDILTYSRGLVARLFYPVANPAFGFEFCKGYYARVADDRLGGRATRLFVQPLLRSLKKILGEIDYLQFLDSFRYPLSGEFSMRSELIEALRIPSDWGLEVGMLSEVYRNTAPRQVCQVDIADNYDHKHQELGDAERSGGLSRMSYEIAKSVFRKLGTEGIPMGRGFFRALKASYYREALDMLERYEADACLNGLRLDRHSEECAIEVFSRSIIDAGEQYMENPMEVPFIPNWSRVFSAIPDFAEQLQAAVEADNGG